MIVRQAAFILGIVVAIGQIHHLGGLCTQNFVSVTTTWMNQNLPWTMYTCIDGVDASERVRMAAQVTQKYLQHTRHRGPKIRLPVMIVNGFNCSRIGKRGRYLELMLTVRDHTCGDPTGAKTGQLGEKTSVVRINAKRFDHDSRDQIRRVWRCNNFSQSFMRAGPDRQLKLAADTDDGNLVTGQCGLCA